MVWDPHPSGAVPVPGAAVVTPNLVEARHAAAPAGPAEGTNSGRDDCRAEGLTGVLQLASVAGSALLQRWETPAVLVTLGAGGAMLLTGDGGMPHLVPAPRVQVADPCGAGDRLAASLAVQLANGRALADAAQTAVREAAEFLAAGGLQTLRHGGAAGADTLRRHRCAACCPAMQEYGGQVRILDYVAEHSTTAVVRRIRG